MAMAVRRSNQYTGLICRTCSPSRLHLWKNFSLDNELYQILVEQGANTLINRYYNRADLTNITGITDGLVANNNEALTYNDAVRLSGATTGAGSYGTRLWSYDNNGNRLSETADGVVNSYTYPANSNKLTNVKQGTTTTRAFLYDAAGNITQDLRGTTAYNYTINKAGRVRHLTIGTALTATWTYDPSPSHGSGRSLLKSVHRTDLPELRSVASHSRSCV